MPTRCAVAALGPRQQDIPLLAAAVHLCSLRIQQEPNIPNIGTRGSINLHIIGTAGAKFNSIPTFKELLHLLPSLTALQLSFVGLNTDTQKAHTLQCCTMCTKIGRSISITAWRGPYHAYVDTDFYKTPDLAAAFHSGSYLGIVE